MRVVAQLARDDAAVRPPLKWAGGKRWHVPEVRRVRANHAHGCTVEATLRKTLR